MSIVIYIVHRLSWFLLLVGVVTNTGIKTLAARQVTSYFKGPSISNAIIETASRLPFAERQAHIKESLAFSKKVERDILTFIEAPRICNLVNELALYISDAHRDSFLAYAALFVPGAKLVTVGIPQSRSSIMSNMMDVLSSWPPYARSKLITPIKPNGKLKLVPM